MRLQSFKCNINFQACILPAAGRFGSGKHVPSGRAGANSRYGLHKTAHLPMPNGSSFSQPTVMVSASSPVPVRSAELPACNLQTCVSPQAVGRRGSSRTSAPGPPSPEASPHGQPAPLLLRHHLAAGGRDGSLGRDGPHTQSALSIWILCALGIFSSPARMFPSDCKPFSQGLLQETLGQCVH